MINNAVLRKLALSFPETVEQPHFEKTSFRVKKKIVATLDVAKGIVVVKLSEEDQTTFITYNKNTVYPMKRRLGQTRLDSH